ncbi:hypothetical protein QYG89_15415 [Bacillus sp. B190/17]|uniref:Nucleoporin-interacting protein n=1 Tax=Bacillus lumedeiriae TaxID=3058829 RepID=A0ABW8IC11_9BACI
MEKITSKLVVVFSFLLMIGMVLAQLMFVNSFASTYDQVDFALALERYDVLAMQPHFPGYPYFILGGALIHQWIADKAASLTLFNVLIYASAVVPMYKLARSRLSASLSILTAALIYSAGFVVLMVNQPMSEGAAIAVLWWYVWSIYAAHENQGVWSNILPLFLLSVLLGIRLSYLPFISGVLFLFYKKWQSRQLQMNQLFSLGCLAIMFQLLWIGGVAITEGSFIGFMKLAFAFTNGHFNEWGGTAASADRSFIERLYQLVVENIGWTGMAVRSYVLAGMLLVYLFCFWGAVRRKRLEYGFLAHLFIILISSYFLWALFAQNIDKPRHIIPVITLGLFGLYAVIFSKWKHGWILAFSCLFLCVQADQTTALLKEQSKELPATYQIAAYLAQRDDPFIVYAWEESRVFTYLDVPFPHKEINTYSKFLYDTSYYKNKEILLTDKVIEGFISQGIDLTGKVEPLKEFSSNSLFDPVYHHIVLYKWKSGN